MRPRLPFSVALLVPLCAAQAPTHISPKAAAAAYGTSSNSIPFSWLPTVYQQVHSRDSFSDPSPTVVTQLRLRMGINGSNSAGAEIDVELFMAESPHDATQASPFFANNVLGTESRVFTRKKVLLRRVLDNSWAVGPFFLDTPFSWNGSHVSWRTVVYGNSLGTAFSYPLDAWSYSSPSTSQALGSGCKADNGLSLALHSVNGHQLGGTAQYVGRSFVPSGGLTALLTIGGSSRSLRGVPLPLDLSAAGAMHCSLYTDCSVILAAVTAPGTSGVATIGVPIPNDGALAGSTHYSQFVFVAPGANALGVFTTNGAANSLAGPIGVTRIYATGNTSATSGTVEGPFGLAIGWN